MGDGDKMGTASGEVRGKVRKGRKVRRGQVRGMKVKRAELGKVRQLRTVRKVRKVRNGKREEEGKRRRGRIAGRRGQRDTAPTTRAAPKTHNNGNDQIPSSDPSKEQVGG
jgi:hypothetical protein